MLKPKVGEIVSTSWPISFFKNVVFPALSSPLKTLKKDFNKFLVKIHLSINKLSYLSI